jgi:hypothetical protein
MGIRVEHAHERQRSADTRRQRGWIAGLHEDGARVASCRLDQPTN